ncbi:uncharacterized protein I303_103362 [Kwoniella dejecticola CBS 10117]|uniref:Peptidase S54 rhomboid domain-containing protein n=1 Tax=Kwoniella dejecticola CBS 10117 TaxID=1296121 RepID=A0A1A6A6J3_9TREE|nr:uncharacterized protein I303_03385 [Kwoniella dejecticola CBS 10117]OBR85674.1 hypothetical protein I303_03385 [Kwoniella dejecticola CBS 10117]
MSVRNPFLLARRIPSSPLRTLPTSPIFLRSIHLASPASSSNVIRPTLFTRIPSTTPSFASAVIRRAFGHTSRSLIRSSYFPKGSGYGGGYGGSGGHGGGNWFSRLRGRIDRIPTMTLIYGLIGINGGVFLLWQYAISSAQRFRDPTLFFFLQKNFILNEVNVFSGRVWTLVTSAFSHMSGSHIFVNCLGLYFLAPAAAGLMGSSAFLGLYLGAGIFSSLASLTYHRMKSDRWMGSEGASGAIYACLSFYGAMFPQSTVLMFFVIPMPVWVAISGIFAWDFYGAIFRPNSGTDSAGHLGGIVYGLGAAMALRRGGFLRMLTGRGRRW